MDIIEILSNTTVIWFLIGLVLMILELVIPGFVLMFFGMGAWVTSLAYYLFKPSLNNQLLIFTISSIVLLFLLRKQLIKSNLFKEKVENEEFLNEEFVGKSVEVVEAIKINKPGQIVLNGTVWKAKSKSDIKKGEIVEIVGKESICLIVEPSK